MHQPLTAPWNSYSFNSPEEITAYTNYCKRIINPNQPDYFASGIKINASFLENTTAFNYFLTLAQNVYRVLKQDYPNLPIFLTFQDQSFNKDKEELIKISKIMINYSDLMAISTYPYWQYNFLKEMLIQPYFLKTGFMK
jgi:arabinogalactan endo-1,4-beta-galactosidase